MYIYFASFLLLVWLFVSSGPNPQVYQIIYIALGGFTLVWLGLAVLSKGNIADYRLYGSISKEFLAIILVGMVALGFILSSNTLGFSFASLVPQSIQTSISDPTTAIFVLVVISPLFEEFFRAVLLVPTLNKALHNKYSVSAIFMGLGLILVALQQELLVGIAVFGVGLFFAFNKNAFRFLFDDALHFIIMVVFLAAFAFAILHVYAYNDQAAVLAVAFIFAIIAEIPNQITKSSIPSMYLHSIMNALASVALFSSDLPLIFSGMFIIVLYVNGTLSK